MELKRNLVYRDEAELHMTYDTFDIFENRTYKQNSHVLYSITAENKTSKITLQKTSKQKFKILISVVLRKTQFECCFVASQRIINREKHIHILLKIKFSQQARMLNLKRWNHIQ